MKILKSYRLGPATIAHLYQLRQMTLEVYGRKWNDTDIVEFAISELVTTMERRCQEKKERGW